MPQKLLFVIGRDALITFLTLLLFSFASLAQHKIIAALNGNNGCRYQTVSISIQNPPANATGYTTNFGDGAGAISPHLNPTTAHYYSTAGAYVITSTINTPSGPVFVKSDTIYINNLPEAMYYTTNGNTFCNPGTVCFVDSSKTALPLPGRPVAPITNEIFLPGDGSVFNTLHVPPASRNFCYTYPSPDYNVYTQTLRVRDTYGCTDTFRRSYYVYVAGDPGTRFSVNAPIGCNKTPTQFT
ncbi:MAG: hypothetical protein IT247_09345, partial [Bacteroidia bacterium]|nr:hypothetical protein [Bacteroidia bacterium]